MISDATMKMLEDEAWEFFRAEAGVGTDKLRAFTATIRHVFEHALEEGVLSENTPSSFFVKSADRLFRTVEQSDSGRASAHREEGEG